MENQAKDMTEWKGIIINYKNINYFNFHILVPLVPIFCHKNVLYLILQQSDEKYH